MTNYIYLNFQCLLRSLDCWSVEDFQKLLEKEECTFPKSSKGTLEKFNNPEAKPGSFQISTLRDLKEWYKRYLDRLVSIEELKNYDLSRYGVTNWKNEQIQGDFVAFYLDPVGSGELKGMFLRLIEDEDMRLRAYVISNLRSLDFLKESLSEMNVEEIYKKVVEHRGCKLLSGFVDGNRNVVEVEVIREGSRHKITLILDISRYMDFVREDNSNRTYCGGLGIQIVTNDTRTFSPYVTRIGLIRVDKTCGISLRDQAIRDFLMITPHETSWGPLKINLDRDSLWFEWFMRKYEENSGSITAATDVLKGISAEEVINLDA